MSVKMRQKVEREIVGRLIDDLLTAGFRLSPSSERGYDVDEMLLGSRDKSAIMERAFEADECHLFVHDPEPEPVTVLRNPDRPDYGQILNSAGWVYLVYGNDGWDVVSDYTTNLEPHMAGANVLADEYA